MSFVSFVSRMRSRGKIVRGAKVKEMGEREEKNEEPETTQILLIQLPHSVGKGICGNEWRMGGIDAFSDDGVSSDVFAVFFS